MKIRIPKITVPKLKEISVQAPEIKLPEVKSVKLETPGVVTPEIKKPAIAPVHIKKPAIAPISFKKPVIVKPKVKLTHYNFGIEIYKSIDEINIIGKQDEEKDGDSGFFLEYY